MLSAAAFNCLYVATGVKSLENTAFHCLAAGFLFTPVVMLTGLFSWWLNYLARPVRPIFVKLSVSLALFILSLLAFTWRGSRAGNHGLPQPFERRVLPAGLEPGADGHGHWLVRGRVDFSR